MFDLKEYLTKQKDFSFITFGPGYHTEGIIDHISKEFEEIRKQPYDLEEWIDVVILALDGAWRSGYNPEDICEMLEFKLNKNINRKWPDWRTAIPGKAIEHIREENIL